MKKLLLLTLLLAFVTSISYTASSQSSKPEKIMVNISDLTPAQLAEIKANDVIAQQEAQLEVYQKKIEKYGNWVGVGGEVGIAVKEGLEAVVDVAGKFGSTDVGKFTMVLVAWKVMGKDVIKIILGIFFFATLVTVIILYFKRIVLNRRVLIKNEPQGFWRRNKKEWEVVESKFDEGDKMVSGMVGMFVFLLGIWITYGIMF